ncbi:hypothetical protein [Micromonospora sp. NPDC006431]|uniref:hypothetical protein n=1 Tax=Micromonospora sp. NPDC006431 TaxID=3364235 RepID=UPI0036A5950F
MDEPTRPERFDVRITDGRVEVFDGTAWVPYREVHAEDPGPLVRGSNPSGD